MKELGKIVALLAPHGTHDGELTDRVFGKEIPDIIEIGATNVVILEDASGNDEKRGKNILKLVERYGSLVKATHEIVRGTTGLKQEYDGYYLDHLMPITPAQRIDEIRRLVLCDRLLESHPRHKLLATLEYCSEARLAAMPPDIMVSELTGETSRKKRSQSIEDLEKSFNDALDFGKKNRSARDSAMMESLERDFLLPSIRSGTRTNLIITLGSRHNPLKYLSPAVAGNFDVESRKFDHFRSEYDYDIEDFDDFSNARKMQEYLIYFLNNDLWNLLAIYRPYDGCKKFEKSFDGQNIFGHIYALCRELPPMGVIKVLQEILGVDCHVAPANYAGIEIHRDLLKFKTPQSLVEFLLSEEVGIENNDSEMNIYVERKIVLHCLLAACTSIKPVSNPIHRASFEEIVSTLDDVTVMRMATEIRTMNASSGGSSKSGHFGFMMECVLGAEYDKIPTDWPKFDEYRSGYKQKIDILRKNYPLNKLGL